MPPDETEPSTSPFVDVTISRRPARRRGKDNKSPSDDDNAASDRAQVAFRMDKDAYRELKRMAIDELRERKGLKKFPS
jgi:hypothetical protein